MEKLVIIIFILFSMVSCGSQKDFDDITFVNNPEILALKTDKPEVYTGELVKAEMLMAKPLNFKSEYHTVWFLCDPGDYGETEEGFMFCMSNESVYLNMSFDTDYFEFIIKNSSLIDYGLTSKYVYVFGGICIESIENCKNKLKNINKNTLFGEKSIFKLSFKRVRVVSDDYILTNKNPVIKDIYIDGKKINGEKTVLVKKEHSISIVLDNKSYYGNIGENEFMKIFFKTNFGYFSIYELIKFYGDNNLEVVKLRIDDSLKKYDDKKIYIVVNNLRGGVSWKVIDIE